MTSKCTCDFSLGYWSCTCGEGKKEITLSKQPVNSFLTGTAFKISILPSGTIDLSIPHTALCKHTFKDTGIGFTANCTLCGIQYCNATGVITFNCPSPVQNSPLSSGHKWVSMGIGSKQSRCAGCYSIFIF